MSEQLSHTVDISSIQEMLAAKKQRMKACLAACASCSLCAESCFLFMEHGQDPRYMPSFKVVNTLGTLYKKKGRVDRKALEDMQQLVWRNCVLCGRCYCPFGIDIPSMISFARSILRKQGLYGVYPQTCGSPEAQQRNDHDNPEEPSP